MIDTDTQFALLGCRLNAAQSAGILTPPQILGLERLSLSSQIRPFPNDHVVRFLSSEKKDEETIRLCLWHILWQIVAFLPDGKKAFPLLSEYFPSPTPKEPRFSPTIYAAGSYLGNATVLYPPNERIEIVKHETTGKLLSELQKPTLKNFRFTEFIAWRMKNPGEANTHLHLTLLPEVKVV